MRVERQSRANHLNKREGGGYTPYDITVPPKLSMESSLDLVINRFHKRPMSLTHEPGGKVDVGTDLAIHLQDNTAKTRQTARMTRWYYFE